MLILFFKTHFEILLGEEQSLGYTICSSPPNCNPSMMSLANHTRGTTGIDIHQYALLFTPYAAFRSVARHLTEHNALRLRTTKFRILIYHLLPEQHLHPTYSSTSRSSTAAPTTKSIAPESLSESSLTSAYHPSISYRRDRKSSRAYPYPPD